MSETNASAEYVPIKVRVIRNGDKLTLDPQRIDLRDWEWVEWTFEGLQEGESGFISFAPPLPRLGPFSSLRSFDARHFLGKGNKGPQDPRRPGDDYGYLALVLSPESPYALAKSPDVGTAGAGVIHNVATGTNTAPQIHVTYSPPPNPSDPNSPASLEVTPDPVGLNRGDTATWLFEGLPENAFASFKFIPGSNTPDLNAGLGPFLAFNACNGDNGVTVEASAMGFAAAYPDPVQYPGFTYHIELRDWNGKLLASHDPAIDNLGGPPTI